MNTHPDPSANFGRLCDAIRAAGLDPISVLCRGASTVRAVAAQLRAEGRAPRLAACLDLWADGLEIDVEAYKLPVNTPERVAEHRRAREFYARGYAALEAAR